MSGERSTTTDFARLARELGAAGADQDRLMLAVDAAVEFVDGCIHAGITLNVDGECRTLASSGDAMGTVNRWQNEMGEGPCHLPGRTDEVVVIHDLATDERWGRWGRRVHQELRLGSMLSLLVYSGRRTYGTLSLYADRAGAFDGEGLATAQALAGHLAVSLTASREIEGLQLALTSRTVIGQAEGIIMERLDVDADQALAYLKRVSSHANRKLVELALEIVETRALPEV